MDRQSRRDWLQRLGLAGALGLAGCQGLGPDDGTTTDQPRTSDTPTTSPTETATTQETSTTQSASIDADVTINSGETVQVLQVTGTLVIPAGIETITVAIRGKQTTITLDGATEHSLDATLEVQGGREYVVTVTVRDTTGTEYTETLDVGFVPTPLDVVQPDRLVGAHYYPWYEMHGGHQNWTADCVSDPVLGEYAADDPDVVSQHIRWCLNHGIRWLSVSWWGPDSGTDEALGDTIVELDLFKKLNFSILYETSGRLEEYGFDLDSDGARDRLRSDLQYLNENYFQRDNYLHFDGRPVLFLYIANALRGDIVEAYNSITEAAGVRPYLLADLPFTATPSGFAIIQVADAVTTYGVYADRPDIKEIFHDRYATGNQVLHLGAEAVETDYIPAVTPGFNDTAIPDSQREDNPVLPATPERYARVCDQVGPHLADAQAVLVTSFNEWYENTQIEPSEEYGTAYLELTRDNLATGSVSGYTPPGTAVRLAFNKTIVPAEVNPDSSDTRELAFMMGGLRIRDEGTVSAVYDIGDPAEEPLFVEGVFHPEDNKDRTWRWFGGHTAESTMYVDGAGTAETAVLVGQPMRSNEIEATVYVGDKQTDQVAFGKRDGTFDEYEVSLT